MQNRPLAVGFRGKVGKPLALERFLESGLRELPVVEGDAIIGVLDEGHITRAYHEYLGRLGEGAAERLSALPASKGPAKNE